MGGGVIDYIKDKNIHLYPITLVESIYDLNGKSLQSLLDGKQPSGSYSLTNHNHDAVYSKLGHTHNILYNDNSSMTVKYGLPSVVMIQTSETSYNPPNTRWLSSLKFFHNNPDGYFTELGLDFFSGTIFTRYCSSGTIYDWVKVINANNWNDYCAAKSHTHDDRYFTESEMNSKLSGYSLTSHNHDSAYSKLNHTHNYLPDNPISIEMNKSGSLRGYGGFIDFHFNGSTADYTSRIIEDASGALSLNGLKLLMSQSNKQVAAVQSTAPDSRCLWAY